MRIMYFKLTNKIWKLLKWNFLNWMIRRKNVNRLKENSLCPSFKLKTP
jgi:hypothetical protein